jgi:beta-lactamase class D
MNRRHVLGALAALAAPPFAVRAEIAQPQAEFRDALAKRFADAGTEGTFVAYDVENYRMVASDKVRSARPLLPASTFKIPNSLIALDTGVVADPDKDVFKWDGVTRALPEWNRDHTLRSALAASAVPVYQEIARRIGPERMQRYVNLLEYGNRNIGGGIDQFWLSGDLRIDPVEQIDFIERLRRGSLNVSKRSQDLVREIMPQTKAGEAVIRAKTGIVAVTTPKVGWLVGWAEKGARATVFALNLDIHEPRHVDARMTIAQQCLGDIGAI